MDLITMLALLLVGHALADYPLQGDFLSRAKNRANPIPGVPWYNGLLPHAAIHAGFAGIITGSLWLGLAEFIAHCIIDDAKCTGKFGSDPARSFNIDQVCHVACKMVWVTVLATGAL